MKLEKETVKNAIRYAGFDDQPPESFLRRLQELGQLLVSCIQPRETWCLRKIEHHSSEILIVPEQIGLTGSLAKTMLQECREVIVFGVTLGIGFEQQLERLQLTNMSDALLFDALGSAAIEQLADELQDRLAVRFEGKYFTDRFSCGYGDFPLQLQPAIFDLLQMTIQCGVRLTASAMMIPTKSVTAMIGISDIPQPSRILGCQSCMLANDCQLRKRGQFCGEN